MGKLLSFILTFFLAVCCNAQTNIKFEAGITLYKDRVEDPREVYSSSSYISKALGLSITHHLTERLSMEPGILWRSYITGTSANFPLRDFTVESRSESHSSANQVFLRLNYDVLKVEEITISPSIAYHRAFDPQSPGALSTESFSGDGVTFESSQVFTGKSTYGTFELGIAIDSQLSKDISLAGFYRLNYLSENQSGVVTYSFENQQEEQARIYRESRYTYIGLTLSIRILKGDF